MLSKSGTPLHSRDVRRQPLRHADQRRPRSAGGTWRWPARSTRPGCAARAGSSGSSMPGSSCWPVPSPARSSPSRRWSTAPASRCAASTSTSPASTSCSSPSSTRRSGRRRTASRSRSPARSAPLERLHRFVVEYYRMCLPAPNGRASKNNPTPVMAEFCHQLLTDAPGRGGAGLRAARDAAREGPRRRGRGGRGAPRPRARGHRRRHPVHHHVQRRLRVDHQWHRGPGRARTPPSSMWQLHLGRHRGRVAPPEPLALSRLCAAPAPRRPGTRGSARPTP